MWYQESWLWLVIIGLIIFFIALYWYETNRRKSLPTWAGLFLLLGAILVIIGVIVYLSKLSRLDPRMSLIDNTVPLMISTPVQPLTLPALSINN